MTTILSRSLALGLVCWVLGLGAQEAPAWDVNNPPGKHRQVRFGTEEGTWMNLDVSPDGQRIVFDLLGDIYIMPSTGGTARPLRQGLAYEVQPRFSPDGRHILFTSDAGGGDNLWTMRSDGSEAKAITKESFRLLNNGDWMPDGQYVVARKHFTSTRSLGAGELWLYHISGGEGLRLTERKNDQQDLNEPAVSPDGRYVFYSEDVYPGGYFQYNKDPNSQIYAIKRYDTQTGQIRQIAGGPGGACRPQVSPDGRLLAFVRRVRTQSVLYLHDLQTGEEWPVFEGLSKDQQEAWAIFGVYTGFDWSPDGRHIYIWGQGKIWKVDVAQASASEVPFRVEADLRVQETVRFQNPVASDSFDVNVLRHAVTSPDGQVLVFNAVGYLWRKALPDGRPQRLSKGTAFESEPSFSPDGSSIVYVTWDDEEMGSIRIMDARGKNSRAITREKGIFRSPQFSPDGRSIVYAKEGGNEHQGFAHSVEPGIYVVPAAGGEARLIRPNGEAPRFSADGQRIFYQTGGYLFGSLAKSYRSVDLNGQDERIIFNTQYANSFVPSPDNRWIAFTELHQVYIAPFPRSGQPVGLSANTKALPVAKVSRDAGINLHWSADSKTLHWTLGGAYFSEALTDRFLFLEGAADSIPPVDTLGLPVGLRLPSDAPEGLVAFTNARLITMEGDAVIENGLLLVEGTRIRALGKMGEVDIPKSAHVVDCTGKTIMPGFVDVHAHLGTFRHGLSPQKQWSYYANLAYGITTTHDPSTNTEMTFTQAEMVRAGIMVGPRIFSTGTILYGADGDFKAVINNLEDAKSHLRRTQAFGAFSVKSYNQPRREQRQQVIEAARQLGIMVYPEGGSFFYHNMSMVMDGHTGVEHNIPVAPLYDDVIQLWKATKAHNTPTLIVNYGGVNGEYYWYQNTNVWEKERLLSFMPRAVLDSRARHRTMIPQEEYENGHILTAQSCKKLQDAGVNINLGSHGQLQGLGAHWELWMMVQGGMSTQQALRVATINGAIYLGMDSEIGSLKAGKLADLIVLDANPLENIQHSEQVRYTMVNGRLYDAATMNELGHYPRPRSRFFWEVNKYSNNFPWHESTHSFQQARCVCGH